MFIGGDGQLRALSATDLSSQAQVQLPGPVVNGVWDPLRQRLDLLVGGGARAVLAFAPAPWHMTERRNLGTEPEALLLDRRQRTLFVATGGPGAPGQLLVLDAGSFAVQRSAATPPQPTALTLDPDGTRLLLASAGNSSVSQFTLDLHRQWETRLTAPPRQLLRLPYGHKAFALCGDLVAVLDTDTGALLTYLQVGPNAQQLVLKPDGGELYATSASGTVSAIDTGTNEVVAAMAGGLGAGAMAVAADGLSLYIGNAQAGTVSVLSLDNRSTVAVVRVGEGPANLELSVDGRLLFVADHGSDDLAVVRSNLDPTNPNTLLTLLPSPPDPAMVLAIGNPAKSSKP